MPLDERRAQLLEAGLELFQEQSYADVSIEDIATAVGVSKGLLYHYFGGKRAFYVAVVQEAADRMVEAAKPDRSLPPALQAMAGMNAYLDFVQERAGVFKALMQGGLGTDPDVAAIVRDTRLIFAHHVLEGVGVSPERPVFMLAARTYIGGVEAASLAWLEDPRVTREQLMGLLLSALEGTIRAAAALDPEAGLVIDPDLHNPMLPG
jgi:AcrR family transcriptional regulator